MTSSDLNDPLGEVADDADDVNDDTNQTGYGACKVNVIIGDMEDGGDDTAILKLSCP